MAEPSDETASAREELRAAVRRSVDRSAGPRPYLVGEPDTTEAYDAQLWRILAAEVGVAGLVVPEELDGAGATVADAAVVAEELGRGLAPVPFLATVALATPALLAHAPSPVAQRLLTRIATDAATATLACSPEDGSPVVDAVDVRAGQVELTGEVAHVVGGADVDVLVVPANSASGSGLYAIDADAAGVHRQPRQTLDLTRPVATVSFDRAAATTVADAGASGSALRTALDLAVTLLACEQVGGAQRCLDDAVEYAKHRVQFGRPIGSFQAVKHTLVDVLLAVELARSAAEVAVAAADDYLRAPDERTAAALGRAASSAKATCADAYSHAAEEALHVHGGIGFTWEHDAHLHYRRARATELFLGTPHTHRERLASLAGLS